MKHLFFLSLLALLSFTGCTEIEMPLSVTPPPVTDRAVLIEKLTGVSCVNCPRGDAAVKDIKSEFEGKVFSISIHGDDSFTVPIKDASRFDFRTQVGKDIESGFTFLGKPSAVINRVPFNNNAFANPSIGQWRAAVEKELNKPHVISLFAAVDYDENEKRIQLDVTAIPLIDMDGIYTISVYLTQSGIVDAQLNGNTTERDYVHDNVLLDMMTSFSGDLLGRDLKKDNEIRKR